MTQLARVGVLGLVAILSCSAAAQSDTEAWRVKMRALSARLSDAIPLLYPGAKQDSSALAGKIKSVLMHDLLRRFPKSEFTGEALYVIANSYDALGELGLWRLHEMYYLACIKKVPHSKQAEKCYKKYEESNILGFSGSGGTHMPKAVRAHLDRVRRMATPLRAKK